MANNHDRNTCTTTTTTTIAPPDVPRGAQP